LGTEYQPLRRRVWSEYVREQIGMLVRWTGTTTKEILALRGSIRSNNGQQDGKACARWSKTCRKHKAKGETLQKLKKI